MLKKFGNLPAIIKFFGYRGLVLWDGVMLIGLPLEVKKDERRVSLLPEAVARLGRQGHRIFVPQGYGQALGLMTEDYAAAGATVLADNQAVYEAASLIVKVKEPVAEDFLYLNHHHILFCYCHLASSRELTQQLLDCGCRSYAFEMVQDQDGRLPLLKPMSLIAGMLAADIGMQFCRHPYGDRGLIAGFEQAPMRALILGGGHVGMAAAKRFAAVGVITDIIDNNPAVVARWQQHSDFRGRVQGMPTAERFEELLTAMDMVIGAGLQPGLKAPCLISQQQLSFLPAAAVLVDVSIDQGGCFASSRATTHSDPIYKEQGIIHYAVTNMPSAAPTTASQLLSKAVEPWVQILAAGKENPSLQAAQMTDKGDLVFQPLQAWWYQT